MQATAATTAAPGAPPAPAKAPPVHPDDAVDKRTWAFQTSYPYLVTPKKLRGARWGLWYFIFGAVIVAFLATATIVQVRFNKRVRGRGEDFYASPSLSAACQDPNVPFEELPDVCRNLVFSRITPIKWDPSEFSLTVQYDVALSGDLADPLGRLSAKTPMIIDAIYSSKEIKPKERANSLTVTVPIGVDVSQYPFETYTATLYFFPVFVGNASAGEQPGIVLQQADLILNNLPSFAWDKPSVNTTEDYAQFQISFRRTPIVKVVVIFTWAVMHLWVVIVIFLTGQVIFRDREPQPIMTWVAASIFSMGAIRAAQPIAPAVGTVADMVTYIWAILVIALSSFICFVFNFRRYKPKPKDKELEKREKKMKWRKYLKEEAEEEKKKAETTASASTSTLTPSPESSSSSTPVLTSSHLNSSPPRQQIHQHYVPQTAYAPQQPAYAPETTYAPVTTQAYANAQQLPLAPPARVQSARRDVKEFVQQEYQGKLQEQYRRQ